MLKTFPKTFERPAAACACLFVAALVGAAGARAQGGERPGPMQSGPHASEPAVAAAPASAAASAPGTYSPASFDPKQLFTNVCGWCHSSGGRAAGKGPKLMGTTLTDGEISYRIRTGKTGQMPAFGTALNEAQIAAVIDYIRNLKPEGAP